MPQADRCVSCCNRSILSSPDLLSNMLAPTSSKTALQSHGNRERSLPCRSRPSMPARVSPAVSSAGPTAQSPEADRLAPRMSTMEDSPAYMTQRHETVLQYFPTALGTALDGNTGTSHCSSSACSILSSKDLYHTRFLFCVKVGRESTLSLLPEDWPYSNLAVFELSQQP